MFCNIYKDFAPSLMVLVLLLLFAIVGGATIPLHCWFYYYVVLSNILPKLFPLVLYNPLNCSFMLYSLFPLHCMGYNELFTPLTITLQVVHCWSIVLLLPPFTKYTPSPFPLLLLLLFYHVIFIVIIMLCVPWL
jgi:hypothetical protein